MKHSFLLTTFLLLAFSANAQLIWHHPDSLVNLPHRDSIDYTEGYTVLAVVKSLIPDSTQLLWGIKANDTLETALLTNAIFDKKSGVTVLPPSRDYSKWSIVYYHTGCRMDSTKQNTFWLGGTDIHYTDSMPHRDSLSARITMQELLYSSRTLTRRESATWQSYMAMKYGITMDYAPYLSPAGDTLWHHEQDAEFYHHVVAIGADSAHQWMPNQSVCLEGTSMHLRSLVPMEEGEYFLLGDDDAPEQLEVDDSHQGTIARTWRIRAHNTDKPCTLAWKPSMYIPFPDSVWVDVSGANDELVISLPVDSVIGDSVWYFTYRPSAPITHLSVRCKVDAPSRNISPITYTAGGVVSLPFLDPEKIYTYALFTNIGQLLFRPSPSRPDAVNLGYLPRGIYRLDAIDQNQLMASVPVIVP